MHALAFGALTSVGLAALAPLMVAATPVAGEEACNHTLAIAAVRHAAVSVHEQSRVRCSRNIIPHRSHYNQRVKHNMKLLFQIGDKAVALFNALVAAEGAMPLADVITNAECIMRSVSSSLCEMSIPERENFSLFSRAREEFHRTEAASRVRLPHGKKNAGELQKILNEAETILRQLVHTHCTVDKPQLTSCVAVARL